MDRKRGARSRQGRGGRGGAAKLSGKFVWAIVRWGPGRCPLYGVRRRPLLGGFKCISIMGSSIGGSGTVRSRGGVRATGGPLIEVQLYTYLEDEVTVIYVINASNYKP